MESTFIWEKDFKILIEYVETYSGSVALVITNHDKRILHCNCGFLELLKIAEMPIGKSITDFMTRETIAGLKWVAKQRYKQDKWTFKTSTAAYRAVCHIFRSEHNVLIFIDNPLLTDDAFIEEFEIVNREFASIMRKLQRKNLEIIAVNKALQENEIMQNQAARIANIGQWTWYFPSNKIVLAENFYRIWGMNYDATITTWKPFVKTMHPDDRQILSKAIDDALTKNKPYDSEFRFYHTDGTQHYCRVVGQVDWNADGSPMRMVGVIQDITERKNYEDKITHLAFYDTLTGLPNRRMFLDRCYLSLANAKRYDEKIAIVFVDLDGFKKVNDTLGHDAGDMVLKHIAKHLEASIRIGDTAARMGGDEFMMILSKVGSVDPIVAVAERILEGCKQPILIKNQTVTVGASIGISFAPDDGEDASVLMKKADSAMYKAKQSGGNRIVVFTAEEICNPVLSKIP